MANEQNLVRQPGPGRPKGSVNKTGLHIREAVIEAFFAVGGAKWVTELAQKDPKTFAMLMSKCMPQATQQIGDDGKTVDNPISISIKLEKPEPKDAKNPVIELIDKKVG